VSLTFAGRHGAGKGSFLSRRIAGLLRSRVGDDVVISAEDRRIFGLVRKSE